MVLQPSRTVCLLGHPGSTGMARSTTCSGRSRATTTGEARTASLRRFDLVLAHFSDQRRRTGVVGEGHALGEEATVEAAAVGGSTPHRSGGIAAVDR